MIAVVLVMLATAVIPIERQPAVGLVVLSQAVRSVLSLVEHGRMKQLMRRQVASRFAGAFHAKRLLR